MADQEEVVSFTREGVWRGRPFKVTVEGAKELPEELNEFLVTSDKSALLLVSKKTMQKLLDDDAHYQQQVKGLQQRGTELVEEARIYRRLALTDSQKEFVAKELEALRERLEKSYGQTAVGSEE